MSAIVTAVLEGTLGLLLNRGKQSLLEKLKDGDVTNQQLRSWIVDDIDNVNSKLDAFARSDLKTSVSFFREGLVFLKEAMSTKISHQRCKKTGHDVDGREVKTSQSFGVTEATTAGVNTLVLAEKLRELNLADLDESCRKALSSAKTRFDDARSKATVAFNNETLSPSDRIIAMAVRLMATILAEEENPGIVLELCRLGLAELHSAAIAQENFKTELKKGLKVMLNFNTNERRDVISSVCHINRIIYDITHLMGEEEKLFLLPCVDIENEKVDPLRDARVAQTLRKVGMGDRSVVWSFGEETEKKFRLRLCSIATNNSKQFFVVYDLTYIKVFDSTGTFLTPFGLPSTKDECLNFIRAVATDKDDNIYVLVNHTRENIRASKIYMFDKEASFKREFVVESEFSAATLIVEGNHLLIPGIFHPGSRGSKTYDDALRNGYIVMYNRDGRRIGRFSEKRIGIIRDITADDNGYVMVLNNSSWVYVFALITANNNDDDPRHDHLLNPIVANFLKRFKVAPKAGAIAFHWPTGNLVIASQSPEGRSRVLLYSMEGNLERGIDIELEESDSIEAATVTADGSICVATRSKVLVL